LSTLKKRATEKLHQWVLKSEKIVIDKKNISFKIKIGILIIILSFVIGWGGPAAMAFLAFYYEGYIKYFIIAGSAFYFVSWGVWALGMFLVGKENKKIASYYLAKYLRKKLFRESCADDDFR
jgi:hypothetical protein